MHIVWLQSEHRCQLRHAVLHDAASVSESTINICQGKSVGHFATAQEDARIGPRLPTPITHWNDCMVKGSSGTPQLLFITFVKQYHLSGLSLRVYQAE